MDLSGLEPTALALLLLAAFVGGWVDAIAGGGGLIVLPAILGVGLPPHLALGTNKLAGTMGTLSSSWAYVRRGIVRPRAWSLVAAATVVGALAGTLAVAHLPADLLRRAVPVLIAASALYVLLRPR
ncbi:MAG: TSUP family transporter, partial [Gammaproteobacteria bacterium]|nr:TSUP family transporter [Gammaproteobacteria bacterium]